MFYCLEGWHSGDLLPLCCIYCCDILEAKYMSCIYYVTKGAEKFCKVSWIVEWNSRSDTLQNKDSYWNKGGLKSRESHTLLALHKILPHLEYPGEGVALKDDIKMAWKPWSLAPWKSLLEDGKFYWRSGFILTLHFYFLTITNFQFGDLRAVQRIYNHISRF